MWQLKILAFARLHSALLVIDQVLEASKWISFGQFWAFEVKWAVDSIEPFKWICCSNILGGSHRPLCCHQPANLTSFVAETTSESDSARLTFNKIRLALFPHQTTHRNPPFSSMLSTIGPTRSSQALPLSPPLRSSPTTNFSVILAKTHYQLRPSNAIDSPSNSIFLLSTFALFMRHSISFWHIS